MKDVDAGVSMIMAFCLLQASVGNTWNQGLQHVLPASLSWNLGKA